MSYRYMSHLSSFMRYNEFSVLITFTIDARSDHLAFEDKLASILSSIWLLSLSFLVFLEFVGNFALFYFVVFQHFQSMLRIQQILNVLTNENLMDSNPENEDLRDQSIYLQSVDLKIAFKMRRSSIKSHMKSNIDCELPLIFRVNACSKKSTYLLVSHEEKKVQ